METPFLDIRDSLDVESGGENVNVFLYPIHQDYIALPQTPKVSDDETNLWEDLITAISYFTTAEVYSESTWVPLSFVSSLPVAENEIYLHIADKPLSNRLYYHQNHRNKEFHFQYTGIGSLVTADLILMIYDSIGRIEKGLELYPFSSSTYSDGNFNNSVVDDKKIWITKSFSAIFGLDGSFSNFDGSYLDFDFGGNVEVSDFTNANYWKRILVALDYNGSWVILKKESPEADIRENLTTPDIEYGWNKLFHVDVQNNGTTSSPGEINPIQQSHITIDRILQYHRPTPFKFEYSGALVSPPQLFTNVFSPGVGGSIERFVLNGGEEVGSSGQTRLQIYKHSPGDTVGTPLFTNDLLCPIIRASEGAYSVDITPKEDFDPTELLFSSAHSFRIVVEDTADGAVDMTATFYLRLNRI